MTDRSPLSVGADLSVRHGDDEFAVYDEGDLLVVDAPSLRSLRSFPDLLDRLPVGDAAVTDGLSAAGVTVEVRVRGAAVASVGADVRGNLAGRLLGVPGRVRLRGVADALVRALG